VSPWCLCAITILGRFTPERKLILNALRDEHHRDPRRYAKLTQ
jgi:hypothetical protein